MILLRKEKGISQKKASTELGVSQALLSHYEKGIRECGLDFLVRAATYYDVSCDYLLGRTASRQISNVVSLEADANSSGDKQLKGSVFATMGKTLSINSLTVLFDTINSADMKDFANSAQKYVLTSLYKVFRYFYHANKENKPTFFALDGDNFPENVSAQMFKLEASLKKEAAKAGKEGRAPVISYDQLQQSFPRQAPALLNVIKNVENDIQKDLTAHES